MNPRFILSAGLALLLLNVQAQAVETGAAAPNCALHALGNNAALDLRQFQGKVLYVDFWASWCAPCARSFSFMNDLDRELRDRGLHVLGINLDEKLEDAKNFLVKHQASFTVAVDTGGQCPHQFDVKAMPSSYLIDRKGVIRHVHLGFRRGEAETLRGLAEQLLAEGPARQ